MVIRGVQRREKENYLTYSQPPTCDIYSLRTIPILLDTRHLIYYYPTSKIIYFHGVQVVIDRQSIFWTQPSSISTNHQDQSRLVLFS